MKLKRQLQALMRTILEEAERNADFKAELEEAFGLTPPSIGDEGKGRGGRRTPAVLDPVELVKESERALRAQLDVLDVEQLKDIVAQYGMDPGKLVMKWRDRERIIERIIEMSRRRSTKGDAFLED